MESLTDLATSALLGSASEATEHKLRKVNVGEHDWLFVDLDAEGTRFVLDLHHLITPFDAGQRGWLYAGSEHNYKRIVLNDVEYYDGIGTPSWECREFMSRFPEAYNPKVRSGEFFQRTIASGTDVSAMLIHFAWPESRIFYKSDAARVMVRALVARFFAQNTHLEIAARFKECGEVPAMPDDWEEHPDRPLSPYQRVACLLSLGRDGMALFMDRGTGKTAVAIQRVCMEGKRSRVKDRRMLRVLVVCPPQVRSNWANEFNRFATVPGKVLTIRGSAVDRVGQVAQLIASEDDCAYAVGIIGYDSVPPTLDALKRVPWDLIITDESHFFKSDATKRWQAMLALREVSGARMILTGTPIGNSMMDLWTQLEFLGPGLSGFQSFKAFRSFHGVYSVQDARAGSAVERLLGVKNVPIIQERLARVSFSVTKAEAGLNLPDKVYDIWEVEMTPRQAEIYAMVRDQLAVEIEGRLGDGMDSLTIEHILTSLLRLAQITSGHVRWDPVIDPSDGTVLQEGRLEQIDDVNPKVEGVVDMLMAEDRDPLGKTVIWCAFVEDIRVISARLSALKLIHGCYYGGTSHDERERIVHAFNHDPEFRVLVCNPQTAGEGLNLIGYDPDRPETQTYCDHEIFFSQNWSAIGRAQAEDRAHRRGTRMPVRITDLVVTGTIDEEIRKRVQMKQHLARTVTDVRQILASVLSSVFSS